MKIIAQGAEATIYKTKLFNKDVIIKERVSKKYRDPKLDTKIIKQRNKQEALLLTKIKKYDLNTPFIYFVGTNKIIMQYIKNTNKHFLKTKEIGKEIAKLHNSNIIHGDLNLINIITNNNKIYFIDFGLGHASYKIEEKATDLLVFKKTLLSYKKTEDLWVKILNGYKSETNNKNILKHIEIIEKRARYL